MNKLSLLGSCQLSEKLFKCSFWHFIVTWLIVQLGLRTHFAYILNSQLMIKGGLTLILFFPKAWCLLRIRRSNLCCFVHCPFKIPEYSGGTESFVGISRQRQHLRPLCGTICKCELYCLSKRSRHFIAQQVITFHTF